MNFHGMGCSRSCRRVALSIRVPLGNWGGGLFAGNCESGRMAPEMEHLSLRELC